MPYAITPTGDRTVQVSPQHNSQDGFGLLVESYKDVTMKFVSDLFRGKTVLHCCRLRSLFEP